MQISITDPVFQTKLVIILLVLTVLLTVKKKSTGSAFDTSFTNELKGVAILMVIFSHVGYFLFTDHRFSYPLSVAGGKGVDIFLFLSGFGLTASSLKSALSVKGFYLKRLPKLFVPLWLVLAGFLLLDVVVLGRHYDTTTTILNFLGWFPRADVWLDVNSPLWYFSFVLFYYLLFPLVFSTRLPAVSVLIILISGYLWSSFNLPVSVSVLNLYKLHYLAFPLGMSLAIVLEYLKKHPLTLPQVPRVDALVAKFITIAILAGTFCYTAIHSGVGEGLLTEQLISLIALGCLLVVVLITNFYSRFLTLLGAYSYELYLLHWPIMSRYDFLYNRFPAWLATGLYFVVLLMFSTALKTLTGQFIAIMTAWKTRKM